MLSIGKAADSPPDQVADQLLGLVQRDPLGAPDTQYRALTWAMPTSEIASSLDCSSGSPVSSAITTAMASAMSLFTLQSRCCTWPSPVRSDSKTNRNSPLAEDTNS